MKKKIFATLLAAAMLTTSGAALADEVTTTDEVPAVEQTIAQKQYIVTGFTVNAVTEEDSILMLDCTDEYEGPANLAVTESTPIYDNTGKKLSREDIKEGAKLTMHYNAANPTLMIYPPQYTPDMLIVETEGEGFVDTDVYSNELVNADNSLALNISDETVVEKVNGEKATAEDVKNAHATVFYTNTTRGIPAQTTPSKVIILDNAFDPTMEQPATMGDETTILDDAMMVDPDMNKPAEMGDETTILDDAMMVDPDMNKPAEMGDETTILDDAMMVTPVADSTLTVNGQVLDVDFIRVNNTLMLPVRAVAEAMGLEVQWDDSLKAVTVGTVPMGVSFAIGNDSYTKARMMPFSLGQAPILVRFNDTTDYTYVPVNFFTEILEAQLQETENGSITLTREIAE